MPQEELQVGILGFGARCGATGRRLRRPLHHMSRLCQAGKSTEDRGAQVTERCGGGLPDCVGMKNSQISGLDCIKIKDSTPSIKSLWI